MSSPLKDNNWLESSVGSLLGIADSATDSYKKFMDANNSSKTKYIDSPVISPKQVQQTNDNEKVIKYAAIGVGGLLLTLVVLKAVK